MSLSRYLLFALTAGALACEWEHHCQGDPCQTLDDCSGDLICVNSKCAPPTDNPQPCTWPGHCLNDGCETENDCDGEMICVGGKCAPAGGEQTCTWHGHCIGNTCKDENDCSDNLNCSQSTCVDPTATVWPYNIAVSCQAGYVQVSGDHYNIGTNNIEILIKRQSDWTTVWGPMRYNAVKVQGKPGGSFNVNTNLNCPVGQANSVHVYGADLLTGRYRDKIFNI